MAKKNPATESEPAEVVLTSSQSSPSQAATPEPAATIEPRQGQMVDFEVTTRDPVFRFGTRQQLVSGEAICWNDYYFHLWRAGAIRPLALAEPTHA